MSKIQRVKKVVKWLIYQDFADNDKELAELLGYTKSSFSQIINEKVPLSEKFIDNISLLDQNINKVWILTGEGEMLKNDSTLNEPKEKYSTNMIPIYEDVETIGGTSMVANMSSNNAVNEWIDAGDWFNGATAAIRHYGDSMLEYPSGCILVLREVLDRSLIIWGRNYCIETTEFRITKKIYDDGDIITAFSTNEDTYKNGRLINPPLPVSKKSITKIYQVLGYVVKEYSNGPVMISK